MSNQDEGTTLERQIGDITVKVTIQKGESVQDSYNRLNQVCNELEFYDRIRTLRQQVFQHFRLNHQQFKDIGINSDYHRVIISFLFHPDLCLGATEVSIEWGGINTGQVSRVFTGSHVTTKRYEGHFEKCEDGKYRLTPLGWEYALGTAIPEILSESP